MSIKPGNIDITNFFLLIKGVLDNIMYSLVFPEFLDIIYFTRHSQYTLCALATEESEPKNVGV